MSDSDDSSSPLYDLHDQLVISHAVLSSFCAFFLIPAALITARYMRNRPVWFKVHSIINIIVTLLITACFIMGVKSINGNQIGGPESDTHHRFGLVAFLLILLQSIVGIAVHFTRPGGPPPGLPAPSKHWSRYFHAFMGICVAGSLYGCIYSGMSEWTKASDVGTATPTAVRVVYWVLVAIIVVVYFMGFFLRPGTLKSEDVTGDTATTEKDKEALVAE